MKKLKTLKALNKNVFDIVTILIKPNEKFPVKLLS